MLEFLWAQNGGEYAGQPGNLVIGDLITTAGIGTGWHDDDAFTALGALYNRFKVPLPLELYAMLGQW